MLCKNTWVFIYLAEHTSTCVIDADVVTWVRCSESIQTWAIVTSNFICAVGIWTTYRCIEQTFIYIYEKKY